MKYEDMRKEPWDGTTPVWSNTFEELLEDYDHAVDFAEEHQVTLDELQLEHCKPKYLYELDPSDIYWSIAPKNDLGFIEPEDFLPQPVAEAFEKLNKVIRETRVPVSWSGTNIAADLDEENKL